MKGIRPLAAGLSVLALSSLATVLAFFVFRQPLTGVDDANIFFVYARHLASGFGLVYNQGGERVEGCSSLLWTLVGSLGYRYSSRPEVLLLAVNTLLVAIGAGIGAFSLRKHRMHDREERFRSDLAWGGSYVALLLLSPGFIAWSTIALMECALWSTLLLAAAVLVERDVTAARGINPLILPLFLLLLLTRPEALLWVPLFCTVLVVRRIAGDGLPRALRAAAPAIATCVLGMLALTLWRLHYFGYPLPNTYYAKVSPSPVINLVSGTKYLLHYFGDGLVAPVVAITILLTFFVFVDDLIRRRGPLRMVSALPLFGLTALLAPMLTGGDHFGAHRLYQYAYPLLLYCALHGLRYVLPLLLSLRWRVGLPTFPRRAVALLAGFALFVYLASQWGAFAKDSRVAKEFAIAASGRAAGTYASALFAPLGTLPSLGVTAAGGIKLAYLGEVVDLMGLNSTAFAHHPGSRRGVKGHAAFSLDIFADLAPQVVWPQLVSLSEWEYSPRFIRGSFENRVLNGLFDNKDFQASYRFAFVTMRGAEADGALVGWYRRELLEALREAPGVTVQVFAYSSQP
jgi:arabinofuranosyltransferase